MSFSWRGRHWSGGSSRTKQQHLTGVRPSRFIVTITANGPYLLEATRVSSWGGGKGKTQGGVSAVKMKGGGAFIERGRYCCVYNKFLQSGKTVFRTRMNIPDIWQSKEFTATYITHRVFCGKSLITEKLIFRIWASLMPCTGTVETPPPQLNPPRTFLKIKHWTIYSTCIFQMLHTSGEALLSLSLSLSHYSLTPPPPKKNNQYIGNMRGHPKLVCTYKNSCFIYVLCVSILSKHKKWIVFLFIYISPVVRQSSVVCRLSSVVYRLCFPPPTTTITTTSLSLSLSSLYQESSSVVTKTERDDDDIYIRTLY